LFVIGLWKLLLIMEFLKQELKVIFPLKFRFEMFKYLALKMNKTPLIKIFIFTLINNLKK